MSENPLVSPGQLNFEGEDIPILRPVEQSSTDGDYLKIISAIIVDEKLAIMDIPNRTLQDVEFTTSVQSVEDLPAHKKTLINPNAVLVIDERNTSEDRQS